MLTETQIKKLNTKFESLSSAEQRVLIAKDVLAQVKAEKFIPRRGNYIKNLTIKGGQPSGGSVQKHFDEITCSCCALGACLLSATKFKNKLEFGDIYDMVSRNSSWDLLKGIFSAEQLNMIEYAFEASHSGSRVGEDSFGEYNKYNCNEIVKCVDFGKSFPYESDRLIAIMKNIIKNKGTFKP